MTNAEYVRRVLKVFERCDAYGEIMWRVKGDDVTFAALCSDLFWWGTADAETITADDLDLLEVTADDLTALDEAMYLPELFAARKRGMRPQTPFGRVRTGVAETNYVEDGLDPRLRALFDFCGPVRDRKDEG